MNVPGEQGNRDTPMFNCHAARMLYIIIIVFLLSHYNLGVFVMYMYTARSMFFIIIVYNHNYYLSLCMVLL